MLQMHRLKMQEGQQLRVYENIYKLKRKVESETLMSQSRLSHKR